MHNKTSPPRPRGKHMTIFGHFAEERTFAKSVVHTRVHGNNNIRWVIKQDLCKRGRGAGPRVASKTFNTEGNRYFKARAEIY